jgi:hypothetical protein
MKMQVMSDLHTEKYVNPLSFLSKLKFEPDLDFLILAGDTTTVALQSLETLFGVYQFLSSKARWWCASRETMNTTFDQGPR